jgi:uncharacterized UBP type Zn finger protein
VCEDAHSLTLPFSLQETGKPVVELTGPGLTGLINLGNTCDISACARCPRSFLCGPGACGECAH